MSSKIEDRVILLLKEQMVYSSLHSPNSLEEPKDKSQFLDRLLSRGAIAGYGFWVKLGQVTQVATSRWRNVFDRKQRPTTEVLAAIGELWPQYAFWIMTGITDAANGHIAPITATNFPEKTLEPDQYSNRYFEASIALNRKLFSFANVDLDNDKERIYVMERTKPLEHWISGPIANAAYELCATEKYQALKERQSEREKNRTHHLERLNGKNRPQDKISLPESINTPISGTDPLTQHQDDWALYYEVNNGDKEN